MLDFCVCRGLLCCMLFLRERWLHIKQELVNDGTPIACQDDLTETLLCLWFLTVFTLNPFWSFALNRRGPRLQFSWPRCCYGNGFCCLFWVVKESEASLTVTQGLKPCLYAISFWKSAMRQLFVLELLQWWGDLCVARLHEQTHVHPHLTQKHVTLTSLLTILLSSEQTIASQSINYCGFG